MFSTEKYFTDSELLRLTPYICLILGGMYAGLHVIGWILIKEPPMNTSHSPNSDEVILDSAVEPQESSNKASCPTDLNIHTEYVHNVKPLDALRTKEFYLVYFCRFLITPVTQVSFFNLAL